MYTDSIEYLAEQIYHYKTKEYFKEVLVSYTNGNNRSAVVMLYSVVICDLVYKLQELEDKYNDFNAAKILDNIKKEQHQNPNSPSWENSLIKEVSEKTNLLEIHDKENLSQLKNHRNLSAHPVLDQLDILFRPNKENVRSHIRNMLEGVLCKSPLLSNKLTVPFLEDLESIKNVLVKNDDLSRYLESKYLSKINEALSQRLFKDLWKFVFRIEDEKCNENRQINFRALKIMFERNSNQFLDFILNEASFFSKVSHENEDILYYLQELFAATPNLYNKMQDGFTLILKEKAERDIKIFTRSIYLSKNPKEHFEEILKRIQQQEEYTLLPLDVKDRDFLYSFSKKDLKYITEFLDFMIHLFKTSQSYDSGDLRFLRYIKIYLNEFTLDQYKDILNAINSNGQLADRRQALSEDNFSIKTAIEKKYPNQINYTEYPQFKTK